MKVKRLIVGILLSLTLAIGIPMTTMAATSANVTVTNTPSYVGGTNAPGTWTLNGITGIGVTQPNTTYYANPGASGDTTAPASPVTDANCNFTWTNASTIPTDLTVNCGDFSSGDTMTNSNNGSAGATTYGAYSWYSGMTYSGKVVMKSSGSGICKSNLAALTNIKWGAEITTRTTAWATGTAMTATMTISATAH